MIIMAVIGEGNALKSCKMKSLSHEEMASIRQAKRLCKDEGYWVWKLLEHDGNHYLFLCAWWQEVAVIDGIVIPAPRSL